MITRVGNAFANIGDQNNCCSFVCEKGETNEGRNTLLIFSLNEEVIFFILYIVDENYFSESNYQLNNLVISPLFS